MSLSHSFTPQGSLLRKDSGQNKSYFGLNILYLLNNNCTCLIASLQSLLSCRRRTFFNIKMTYSLSFSPKVSVISVGRGVQIQLWTTSCHCSHQSLLTHPVITFNKSSLGDGRRGSPSHLSRSLPGLSNVPRVRDQQRLLIANRKPSHLIG